MARGTQIASLLYPFDTFSMYSTVPGHEGSFLLARDEQGQVHDITSYRSFDCTVPIDTAQSICNASPTIQYLDDDVADYVKTHPGGGAQRVDIIRRTWVIAAGQPPRESGDCVIAECRVSP